jgi:hypothetical protein
MKTTNRLCQKKFPAKQFSREQIKNDQGMALAETLFLPNK